MSAVINGELKPMTAQETSFKSAVLPIVDERLYALQNSFALGGRASAYPANAEGYSVCNCYLLKEGNRAVLLDSGLTVHAESLISQVASLIDPGTRLSVYPLRINEFMSVANVEALADAFDVEQCYSSNADAAVWVDFGARSDKPGAKVSPLVTTMGSKSGFSGSSSMVLRLRLKRLTVTSSPRRATTIWPFLASVAFCTASKSPSMMPASRMLMPRTFNR